MSKPKWIKTAMRELDKIVPRDAGFERLNYCMLEDLKHLYWELIDELNLDLESMRSSILLDINTAKSNQRFREEPVLEQLKSNAYISLFLDKYLSNPYRLSSTFTLNDSKYSKLHKIYKLNHIYNIFASQLVAWIDHKPTKQNTHLTKDELSLFLDL